MLNKVVLMGRLTRDPELRYTPANLAVTSFTLAVDRTYVKQGEQRQADFINIVTFAKTAEFVSKYFSKGQLVAVCGRIQTRSWEDANGGGKRYATEVVAEEVHFAESKRESSSPARQNDDMFVSDSEDSNFTPTFDDDNLPF